MNRKSALLVACLIIVAAMTLGAAITSYDLLVAPAGDDQLVVVDVSDTTMSLTGTTKRLPLSAVPVSVPVQTALDGKLADSHPAAGITDAGSGMVMSTAERTKLTGIEAGAQVNPATATDQEMIDGTETTPRLISPAQARLSAETHGGGTGGTDANAIHKTTSDEFGSATGGEKTAVVGADRVLVEDAENGYQKVYAQVGNLLKTSGIDRGATGVPDVDETDPTKILRYDLSGIPTGTARTHTVGNYNSRSVAATAVSATGIPQQTTARPGGLQEPLIATFKPQDVYDNNSGHILMLHPNLPAAFTVTRIYGSCLADPATELDLDLMRADAPIGLANAAVIDAIDTVAGVINQTSITSAATAAGQCIYIRINADPDDAIDQISIVVEGDWD